MNCPCWRRMRKYFDNQHTNKGEKPLNSKNYRIIQINLEVITYEMIKKVGDLRIK